ncbi:sugar phosphate nucleotidyltransferase, partial [Methylobacterium organophilum]|nr:sugar phosphate nucleotidyltransferase [Methylobacterium organophilum]
MILCGGFGTRLGALTSAMPKPLLPVAGEPFLDVLLFELGRHGFTEIVLLASFHSEKIRAYAADNPVARRFGMTLRVSVEPARTRLPEADHAAGFPGPAGAALRSAGAARGGLRPLRRGAG